MDCTAHRLQCKTLHFPKHTFPVHATRNVQTQLKSTVLPIITMWKCFLLCFLPPHIVAAMYMEVVVGGVGGAGLKTRLHITCTVEPLNKGHLRDQPFCPL